MARITYYLNGVNLNTAGIVVESSTGLIEMPDLKPRKESDWAQMHGKIIDTARPYIKEREIKLNCAWLITTTGTINNVQAAMNYVRETLLNLGQQVRLVVKFPTLNNPLVYNVIQQKGVNFSWKFSGSDVLLKFTISLVEPQPCKAVLKYTAASASAQATLAFTVADGSTTFDIDWGDGTTDYDVAGTASGTPTTYSVSKTHTYTGAADTDYYIIVSGDVYKATITQGTNPNPVLLWTLK